MKKIIILVFSFLLALTKSSCSLPSNTIIVGTMPHLGEPVLNFVQDKFKKESGMNLQVRRFLEFDPINHALSEGSIHANLFQHKPFLKQFNNANNTNLVAVENLYTPQFTAWSFQVNCIDDIPNNARVVIQNDASNRSRSLELLHYMGLITLDLSVLGNRLLTQQDIVSNPRNLRIQEMMSSIIPIALRDDDVYVGIIGAVFAIPARLHLTANILANESSNYFERNVNVLVVRKENQEEDWLRHLRNVLTHEDTTNFINKHFQGTVVPYTSIKGQ